MNVPGLAVWIIRLLIFLSTWGLVINHGGLGTLTTRTSSALPLMFTAEAPRMITEERGFGTTKTLCGAEPRAIDGQRKLRAAKVAHCSDLP